MNSHRVTVIDGPLPNPMPSPAETEPQFTTPPEHQSVLRELLEREPIFHRPEFGITRQDFKKMTAPEFWETTASGRRLSREFILDVLEKRYENPTRDTWEMRDFSCMQIAPDNFLATYTLAQGDRLSRRATIWRRTAVGWHIVYHQGTLIVS